MWVKTFKLPDNIDDTDLTEDGYKTELFFLHDTVKVVRGALGEEEPVRYFIGFQKVSNISEVICVFSSTDPEMYDGVWNQLNSLLRVRGISLLDFQAMAGNKKKWGKFNAEITYRDSNKGKKRVSRKKEVG